MPALKRPASALLSAAAEGAAKGAKKAKVQGCYAQFKGRPIPEPKILRPKLAATGNFKVIAWNVAGLRTFLQKRGAELQRLVKQERPSALGFLEHKLQAGEQVDAAVEALRALLPEYCVEREAFSCSLAQKGYSGVAMLWRKDLADRPKVRAEKLEKGTSEGRTLCLELRNLCVVLTYVPNSGDGLRRINERLGQWDPALRRYLQSLARRKPVVLVGDLNVAHRDLDIWNLEAPHVPKSAATTPEERASFGKLLDAGFVDGFAHLRPDVRGAFTYWSVRAGNRKPNRGLRLDYAVVSKGLVGEGRGAKLLDAFHLPAFAPSGDHCPVGATLRLS